MAVNYIPENYNTVTPYLIVTDVSKLLEFLKHVFNAVETEKITLPDGTIMHAEVRIGNSVVMMGKAPDEKSKTYSMLYVYTEDTDAAYKSALEAGAVSVMEPVDQYYGDRNAGVKDAFGNQWWIATHVEDVSKEELQKRAAAKKK